MGIVREHMNYIVTLLLEPEFKHSVNWTSLTQEKVTMDDKELDAPSVRNFVILTALKI